MSFTAKKSDLDKNCTVHGYPNKPIELIANCGFIFRSDSNSEDLPGFAGAGLFDSYAIEEEIEQRVTYSKDKLITNSNALQIMLKKVGRIGETVEKAYEGMP